MRVGGRIRLFVVFSILGLVNAGLKCLIDSGEAVSDAVDAFLFSWAALKRCGSEGEDIKCAVDVASSIKSVNAMVNVILKAVDKCDGLKGDMSDCGLKASKLTEHAAGLAAASGEVYQKCQKEKKDTDLGVESSPVMCTIDMKDTATSIFKATKGLMKMKKKCKKSDDERTCASNVLEIVASFAGMGEFMAGAVGTCKEPSGVPHNSEQALCAQAVNSALHHTMEVSKAIVDMARKCESEEDKEEKEEHEEERVLDPAPAPVAHPKLAPVAHPKLAKSPLPAAVIPPATPNSINLKQAAPPAIPTIPAAPQNKAMETQALDSGTRLYDQTGGAPVNFANVVFVCLALLPITVVVSFFGGRAYASIRSRTENGAAISMAISERECMATVLASTQKPSARQIALPVSTPRE